MENQYFSYANVVSPITSSDAYTLLHDADPVLYNIIRYYEGIINLHVKPRWNIEVAKIGRTDLVNKPVATTIPYDPLPFATDTEFKFPLLCCFRESEEYDWHSAVYDQIHSTIQVIYMMPPLEAYQIEQIHPFLTHINRLLVNRTKEGSDQNFNLQEQVWIDCGLINIAIESATYGKLPGLQSNLYFPSILLSLKLTERLNYVSLNFGEFNGVDGYIACDGYEYLIKYKT